MAYYKDKEKLFSDIRTDSEFVKAYKGLTLNEQLLINFMTKKSLQTGTNSGDINFSDVLIANMIDITDEKQERLLNGFKKLATRAFWFSNDNELKLYPIFTDKTCIKKDRKGVHYELSDNFFEAFNKLKKKASNDLIIFLPGYRSMYTVRLAKLISTNLKLDGFTKKTVINEEYKVMTIDGLYDDWQKWFGTFDNPDFNAGRFKARVLNKALTELKNIFAGYVKFELFTKYGYNKKLSSYQLQITRKNCG